MDFKFDPHAIEPADEPRSYEPLPVGVYTVQITDAQYKETKSGNGRRVALEFTVVSGAYESQKVWDSINVVNENPTAQKLGQRMLADLCIAAGIKMLTNTDEFIGRTVRVQTKIQPATDTYKASAKVDSFLVAATAPAAPPAVPSGRNPWDR